MRERGIFPFCQQLYISRIGFRIGSWYWAYSGVIAMGTRNVNLWLSPLHHRRCLNKRRAREENVGNLQIASRSHWTQFSTDFGFRWQKPSLFSLDNWKKVSYNSSQWWFTLWRVESKGWCSAYLSRRLFFWSRLSKVFWDRFFKTLTHCSGIGLLSCVELWVSPFGQKSCMDWGKMDWYFSSFRWAMGGPKSIECYLRV